MKPPRPQPLPNPPPDPPPDEPVLVAKAEKAFSTRLDLQAGQAGAPAANSLAEISSSKLWSHFLHWNSYRGIASSPLYDDSALVPDVSSCGVSLCFNSFSRSPIEQDWGPQPGWMPKRGNTKFTTTK